MRTSKILVIVLTFFTLFILACSNESNAPSDVADIQHNNSNNKAEKVEKNQFQPQEINEEEENNEEVQEEPQDNAEIIETEKDTSSLNWGKIFFFILIAIGAMGLVYISIYIHFTLWVDAKLNKVRISWFHMFFMRWRGVDVTKVVKTMIAAKNAGVIVTSREMSELYLAEIELANIVGPLITAHSAGIFLTVQDLKSHYLSGGRVARVVDAIVAAKNADMGLDQDNKMHLDYETACNIDLAGVDIYQAVIDSTHHRVLMSEQMIAFARDGVELIIVARVTVRQRIHKLLKGPGEETVLARINEGIVTIIGMTDSHYSIIENPHELANKVEKQKHLFEDTAHVVDSIDIVSIKIGKDVHAELKVEKARALLMEEQAKEQQEKTKAQAARARVIEAEIEVQKAMAAAFIEGTIDIEKFNKIKNTQADTRMRDSFARSGEMRLIENDFTKNMDD